MHALRDRDNPRSLDGKLTCPLKEKEAQQKLYQAAVEIEAKNWEKRNRGRSFHEVNQEFESQRFRLNQASRWADQALKDKIFLYGELEMRNRIFQENHASDVHEIEQTRQARSEELSEQQRKNPLEFRISDASEFYDPESGSSSGATHVPNQTSTILVSGPCRAAILDCHEIRRIVRM